MKPKKNPKADLRRRWVLFLQIGLIVVLFLTLQAFQWKTYEPQKSTSITMQMDDLVEEEPPVTIYKQDLPPPPPPPVDVPVIKAVPDDADVVEDDIAPTDINFDDFLEPEDIVDADDDEEPVKVPFEFIEDVPLFPGCEDLNDNAERKSCMSSKISKFINKEFDTGLGDKLGLTGMNLVHVMFVVNEQGLVEQIQTRAPHPELEKEAERVIRKLPQMKPGKPVSVSYSIPIRFKVQE